MDLGYNWTNNYLALPPPSEKKWVDLNLKCKSKFEFKKKLF